MAGKHPGGRPLKSQAPEELEILIIAYFHDCDLEHDHRVFKHDEIIPQGKKQICTNCSRDSRTKSCLWMSCERKEKRPYTVSGLAVWLETTRQTLLEYEARSKAVRRIRSLLTR